MENSDNDFDATSELKWPEKGDKLFTSGDDWWHNASLNYSSDDWGAYISGYKRSGDILTEYILNEKREQDILVFPIVFVYRQYLELRLKKLIIDCRNLFDEELIFPKVHDLVKLWSECKRLLEKFDEEVQEKDLDAVSESIEQFCHLDPNSEAFRYPINKSGNRSLPSDLEHINIRNLSEIMEKLSSFFEAGEMMVSVYLDYKQEMNDYFGGED